MLHFTFKIKSKPSLVKEHRERLYRSNSAINRGYVYFPCLHTCSFSQIWLKLGTVHQNVQYCILFVIYKTKSSKCLITCSSTLTLHLYSSVKKSILSVNFRPFKIICNSDDIGFFLRKQLPTGCPLLENVI